MCKEVRIDVSTLYHSEGTANLASLPAYESQSLELAGNGNDITLTGAGPVWLYLRLAHVLHGKARTLRYDSPVTGELIIFDHNPH